jgi:protein TonB
LRFLSGEGPVYPAAARAAHVEGYVVVRYDVNAAGLVENVTVVESQPLGVFDAAALAAVAAWRFAAPTERGTPQPAPARVSRLEFKLGESKAYAEDYER